ncbi:MAG: hypothetical protein Q7R32_05065 [Dehalococcoidia bacterium]|nr:hypothetical protein [Dehalococcoidia bacterium]
MARRKRTGKRTHGGPAPPARPPRRSAHRRPLARWAAAIAVIVLLVGGGLLLAGLLPGGDDDGPRTAAIVDQLSLTQPNPDFIEHATDILERAGFVVDYYRGEQVTVDFYRGLPKLGYDAIILRVHSGQLWLDAGEGVVTQEPYVSLFTGEPYSESKYLEEQRRARVVEAVYNEGEGTPIFAVAAPFIKHSMEGEFEGTLIVMMGCEGFGSDGAARAFLARGASAFISWDKQVSAEHTDAATERLLEKMLVERLPVEDAVAQTAAEVGPDPAYGAQLKVLTAER